MAKDKFSSLTRRIDANILRIDSQLEELEKPKSPSYARMTPDEFTISFIQATNKLAWAADAVESTVFEGKPDAQYDVLRTPADAYRDVITFLRAWSLVGPAVPEKEN